jgi:pantoate--beta-alanine ligase
VGVDAVFAPDVREMYPADFQTTVEVEQLSRGLCGEKRPGHFRGVATVVAKLLSIFRPDIAVFGEKDYQQLQIIRRLNLDLNFGASVLGVATVREPDGLAMSSRNAYLSPSERVRALSLSAGLRRAQQLAREGVRETRALMDAIQGNLVRAQAREDYVSVVDAETLAPLEMLGSRPARALVAAFVGTTRLIDNVPLEERSSHGPGPIEK